MSENCGLGTRAGAEGGCEAVISVGMPVYNGEPYLEDAIRSVLDQTYPYFELLISDNASTDRTAEICQDYAARDSRISYSRNERNVGAARNYNRVFALASGPFFRWANADDVSGPELHAKCLKALQDNPDTVLAYGKTRFIDAQGRAVDGPEDNLHLEQDSAKERFVRFYASVRLTNVIYGLMRSSAVARTALMGDGSFPASDIAFMAALTLQGKFIEIPDHLFFRRMHPGAMSWKASPDSQQSVERQFWNAGAMRFTVPTWRRHRADIDAIRTATIGPRERLSLLAYVARQMYWHKRQLFGELVSAVTPGAVGRASGGRR